MAVLIAPRIDRGRLSFQLADVLLHAPNLAVAAWFAPDAHRLGIVDTGDRYQSLDAWDFVSQRWP